MKIQKEESEFKPITITLETREEADFFWHNLNYDEHETWESYCYDREIKVPHLRLLKYSVFAKFNKIYKPNKSKKHRYIFKEEDSNK